MGSRYGGLKQIDEVGPNGQAIIDYSIYDAIRHGFGKVVFVVRDHFRESFAELFEPKLKGRIELDFVNQELDMIPEGLAVPKGREKPWGTAHAVLVAENVINEPFAVINADDFYGGESYRILCEFLTSTRCSPQEYCVIGYELGKTLSDYGTVSRGVCEVDDTSYLTGVVERTAISSDGTAIGYVDSSGERHILPDSTPVSMNMWGFHPSVFEHIKSGFTRFVANKQHELKAEYYIPTITNNLIRNGRAKIAMLPSPEGWFGVTYREDKPFVEERIRALTESGVYPARLWGEQG